VIAKIARRSAAAAVPVGVLLAAAVPLVIDSPFRLQVMTLAFLNAAVVAALVLSLGYAGLLNLSQGTFYGLGAYATAILVTDHGWSFTTALVVAALFAGVMGVLLALASLRVRDDYFVLVSLGFTFAIVQLIANLPDLTRGREGFFGIPQLTFLGLSFQDPRQAYWMCLGLLAVIYLLMHQLTRGFLGRILLVVHHDDVAARSMGIPPFRLRATAMFLSSAIAGACGAFLVGTIQFISPSDFGFDASFTLSLYVIIGGMASLPGATIAAFVFTMLGAEFRALGDYTVGLVGVSVIIAVFWRGGVLASMVERLRWTRSGGHRVRG